VCAFPNHVQSIELATGGLQSSCRNISRMINGNRRQLSSIQSLKVKVQNSFRPWLGWLRSLMIFLAFL
jgi:hypothetical protein